MNREELMLYLSALSDGQKPQEAQEQALQLMLAYLDDYEIRRVVESIFYNSENGFFWPSIPNTEILFSRRN